MSEQSYKHPAHWVFLFAGLLIAVGAAKADTAWDLEPDVVGPPLRAGPGCIVNAGCLPVGHRVGVGEYHVPRSQSYRSSLEIGAYGPVQFRFHGNRVKMKFRF